MDTASALYGAGLLLLGVVLGGFLHAAWVERHERREYRRHRSQYLRAKAERLEIQNEKWLNDVWEGSEGSLTDVAPGRLPEPRQIGTRVHENVERFVATAPPATVVAFDTQHDATFDPGGWPEFDDRFEDLPTTADPGVVTDSKERDRDAKPGGDRRPAGAGEHEGTADRGGTDDLHGDVGEQPDEEAGEDREHVEVSIAYDHELNPEPDRANHQLTRSFNPPD